MNKKDSKKIDYIAPQVIDLGISPVLSGQDDCETGLVPECRPGNSFGGSCHFTGYRAKTMCEEGIYAGFNCRVGENVGAG